MIECSRCGRQVVMAVGRCPDCGGDLAAQVGDDPERRTVVERGPQAGSGQVTAGEDEAGDSALRRTVVDGAKRPGLDLGRLRQILKQAGADDSHDEEEDSDIRQTVRELPPVAVEEFAEADEDGDAGRKAAGSPVAEQRRSAPDREGNAGRRRAAAAAPPAEPFRATHSLPVAVLTALDDGHTERGETWRIRTSEFVIGHSTGDAVFPHDPGISAAHCRITCRREKGNWRWSLEDLGSDNGTFVRIARLRLRNHREILLGGRRYMFLAPGASFPQHDDETDNRSERSTVDFPDAAAGNESRDQPRLVEINDHAPGTIYVLPRAGGFIGRDAAKCELALPDDACLNPRHARLFRDKRERWMIEDLHTLNGVWVRVEQIAVEGAVYFQAGEQRFRLELP